MKLRIRYDNRHDDEMRFRNLYGLFGFQASGFESGLRTIFSERNPLPRKTSNSISKILTILLSIFAAMGSNSLKADSPDESPLTMEFLGRILDQRTGLPVGARVYSKDGEGRWHFVETADERGSAWPYAEQWVPMPESVERHTTVSAHPFRVRLRPGVYEIEIERGKEYLPLREKITIPPIQPETPAAERSMERTFRLVRMIDMASRGWYSGETHVHRRIVELPNVMLAEDLNVAFPVTYWTTSADRVPDLEPSSLRSQGPSPFGPREDRGFEPIRITDRHVIVPRNTEYEIFSVGEKRHVLGALFILNHRKPFALKAPPIRPIAEQAHAEGALLDLDKHNWPWSLMLVPVAKVDLFELSNNSVWRTNFGFKSAGHALPPWAEFEQESPGVLTEWGWLQFGFEMYYALLNCGFRLSPTAGTASGVHPVPLGHSRVYVHTGDSFDLAAWLEGLKRGRSFVTTGPMLFAKLAGEHPGTIFKRPSERGGKTDWSAEVISPEPIARFEVIVNGEVRQKFEPAQTRTPEGAWRWSGEGSIDMPDSGWVTFRTWSDRPDGRKLFAHTGVWHFEVAGRPVRPPKAQIDYLIEQLEISAAKQRDVLSPEAFREFEQALEAYREIRARAR